MFNWLCTHTGATQQYQLVYGVTIAARIWTASFHHQQGEKHLWLLSISYYCICHNIFYSVLFCRFECNYCQAKKGIPSERKMQNIMQKLFAQAKDEKRLSCQYDTKYISILWRMLSIIQHLSTVHSHRFVVLWRGRWVGRRTRVVASGSWRVDGRASVGEPITFPSTLPLEDI